MSLVIKVFLGVGISIAVLAAAFLVSSHWRFVKTLYLIARVMPYEQAGTGAGTGTILVIGDSTGYGTGARAAGDSVAGRLGTAYPDYRIVNYSVNGDTTADAVQRVKKYDLQSYKLILLQLGGNDILQHRPLSAVEDDVRTLISLLSPHTEHIVMMSAGNVGAAPAFSGQKAEEYTNASLTFHDGMEVLASNQSTFSYVNLYQPPEEDPFVLASKQYMSSDGLHPSSAGYRLWYTTLAPVIEPLLVEK